ncbi:MAG: S-adenosylmethionine:tRNA ribosyltransferase-isomerase [Gemmatales bacterium]|nr:MAG: S-adenosylmethionine:tRNA ribosyltransferase-isomerase [Gemmatales bacterium]
MSETFFDYDLPQHLIAQFPCAERDQCRLLVVDRRRREFCHCRFHQLPLFLQKHDCLVLNDTRVVAARLFGRRKRTGGRWEGLFVRLHHDGLWEMMCQSRGRLRPGEVIVVDPGQLELTLQEKMPDGHWLVQPSQTEDPFGVLERFGHIPLPPYIRRGKAEEKDREDYQTVFAQKAGAVAAPTAGLHFTPGLLEKLQQQGVDRVFVTLHVGPGTFQPVLTEDFRQHVMHHEWGALSEETARRLNECRRLGGRIVAVGTTCVRVLESAARAGEVAPWEGDTDLYIYPPYQFRAVDALITNFHLPKSTLLLLVGAFCGPDLLRLAYEEAIAREYRFYSYGDAMLIV